MLEGTSDKRLGRTRSSLFHPFSLAEGLGCSATGGLAPSPGALPLLLKAEMWERVVGLSKLLIYVSLCFEQEGCKEAGLHPSAKCWELEAVGEAGEGRGWGEKGIIWAETEPTNWASLKPITETSSREATTGVLLDRDWFPHFRGRWSCLGLFHSSGTAYEGTLSCYQRPFLSASSFCCKSIAMEISKRVSYSNSGRNSSFYQAFYSPKRIKRALWMGKNLFS